MRNDSYSDVSTHIEKMTDYKEQEEAERKVYQKFIGKYFIQNQRQDKYEEWAGAIIEIPKHQYEELVDLNSLMHQFALIYRKHSEVQMNFLEIENTISDYKEQLENCSTPESSAIQRLAFIDINRRITNFLTSFNSLIYDFLAKYMVPELFGKKSDKAKEYIKKTNDWFDSNINGFKFIVTLRDYATHRNLPVQIIRFKFDYDEAKDQKLKVRSFVEFRKSTLQENGKLGRKLKDELDSFPDTFSLIPILEEIKIFTDSFLCDFVKFCGELFTEMADKLTQYYNTLDNPDLVSFGNVDLKGNIQHIYFQPDILKKIRECE